MFTMVFWLVKLAVVLGNWFCAMETLQTTNHVAAIREIVNQVLDSYESERSGQRSMARAEILINSMTVFAQRGLQRTTVQHLLDAADISRRTFYKYFRNKLDVLESIYRVFVQNMLMQFKEQVNDSVSLKEIIQNTTQIYFDYHVSMGPVIRLMIEEARRSGSTLAPHRFKAQDMTIAILMAEVRRFGGRRLDPLVIRTLLWTLENYSIHLLEKGHIAESEIDRCKRMMTGIAEAIVLGPTADFDLLLESP